MFDLLTHTCLLLVGDSAPASRTTGMDKATPQSPKICGPTMSAWQMRIDGVKVTASNSVMANRRMAACSRSRGRQSVVLQFRRLSAIPAAHRGH